MPGRFFFFRDEYWIFGEDSALRGGFLFVCPKRNQKCPGGMSPVNASRNAGVHSRPTPRPPFTGDALLEDRLLRPAAPKTRPCLLHAPAHWGLPRLKLAAFCAERTPPSAVKLWWLGSCRVPDHRCTKQVGTHQAVCVSAQCLTNFNSSRPQWAESRTKADLDFARRGLHKAQRDTLP